MSEEIKKLKEIKPQSFEEAKNHIQKFAKRSDSDFEIPAVPTEGGLFGLFGYSVTGDDLNRVIDKVQDYLIKMNGVEIAIIKEFGQVYTSLESLDKEYITAILKTVEAVEETSNQAKAAAEKAIKAQKDIKKTIEEQEKIIEVLKTHKEKLEKLQHLNNIDEIWNRINQLRIDKEKLENLQHLNDIDGMWDRISKLEKDANAISKKVNNFKVLAYILAGCAIGAATFQLIMVSMGML